MAEGDRGGDDVMWTGKHNCPRVLIQCTTIFIAEKAVLKSVLTIIAFFTPDVFMSVWHTVYILSFERTDINSY